MDALLVRRYQPSDREAVVELWRRCGLLRPWNNPWQDIQRKLDEAPAELLVGELDGQLVAACMCGYDGHRGWAYYLGVLPELQKRGIAAQMMEYVEDLLRKRGCPKINLMVRDTNEGVIAFYQKIGYKLDPVVTLSKWLEQDEPYE